MSELTTALSALRANQTALQIVGNNIANANDPTYHRQSVVFTDRPPMDFNGIQIGQGVDVDSIRRVYDGVTESALTQNITDQASVDAQLVIAGQLESMLAPGQGTVIDRLENLFNELERFTANPDDAATRSIVIRTAESLASEVNTVARQIDEIVDGLQNELRIQIDLINKNANEIAALNLKIRNAEVQGIAPNDLLDQRDRLVNELAEVIDVEIVSQKVDGAPQYVLRMADGQINVTNPGLELVAFVGDDGQLTVCRKGGSQVHISGGKLGAITDAQNGLIGTYRDRLDHFVNGLIGGFDRIHATGIGTAGKFDQLVSHRHVADPDIPMQFNETIIPVKSGELLIGVTDPTGTRVMEAISIDPAVDSFSDIVSKINNVENVSAILIEPPGQVSISSAPGYQFDFMMSRPASINTAGLTGTTAPTIHGMYEGDRDTELRFEFSSDGQIGVTPGLDMTVFDDNGALLGTYAVGQGYEPSKKIELGDGVQISLSTGTIFASDSLSAKLVQEPDASNFLAAVGLNTLFTGTTAEDLAVSNEILNDASRLATTRSGDPLDETNAEALVALRHLQILDDGKQTLEDYLGETIGLIGGDVQDLTARQETLQSIAEQLEAERASVSGVDPNEEAVKMLQFQRAFQSIARYITTIDEMFDTINNMVR